MTIGLFPTDWRELWGSEAATEGVGAVYTKRHVVEFMLDLSGYLPDSKPLRNTTVLEPSCGDGAFLEAILERLLASELKFPCPESWNSEALESALFAIDLDLDSAGKSRTLVRTMLEDAGCPIDRAIILSECWVRHGDFLLAPDLPLADFVVGNPPYVRPENVPKQVLEEYRGRFDTLTDRSDLYIAFYERALSQLAPSGSLCFISANRFAKNKYGRELRALIARRYRVRTYLNLEHTQPFLSDVSAYPAILLIDRANGEPTRAATLQDAERPTLDRILAEATSAHRKGSTLSLFPKWYGGGEPWLTTDSDEFEFLYSIQDRFPTLEDSGKGTVVGIGVATGADSVFVLKGPDPTIEPDRLLPLVMAGDIAPNGIEWSGRYLVNPFAASDDGSLVCLKDYPGLSEYLETAGTQLRDRHVTRMRPRSWYRTIDRVWPALATEPKLVIPDIQSGGVIGIDHGQYYPHHNVYWIKSESWPLASLQALLRSTFVLRQIRATSVQMRGGSLRYQAQSLRKVRIPSLSSVSAALLRTLAAVGESQDQSAIDNAARLAFGIERDPHR
ncbi:MAG TPA: Eco57I restriction-modification methylase domain-containing protein [Gemmatimonadales bacterium]|nr:Eco57I restriction-modification methylase domain-containing protein [Gemmatimonadales bacterium]